MATTNFSGWYFFHITVKNVKVFAVLLCFSGYFVEEESTHAILQPQPPPCEREVRRGVSGLGVVADIGRSWLGDSVGVSGWKALGEF